VRGHSERSRKILSTKIDLSFRDKLSAENVSAKFLTQIKDTRKQPREVPQAVRSDEGGEKKEKGGGDENQNVKIWRALQYVIERRHNIRKGTDGRVRED